jgi:hypothetical protein
VHVGNQKERILEAATQILNGAGVVGVIPEKWDGKSAFSQSY